MGGRPKNKLEEDKVRPIRILIKTVVVVIGLSAPIASCEARYRGLFLFVLSSTRLRGAQSELIFST